MIVTIHQPNYIPWLGYFHKIISADLFVSLDSVQYSKNSYQNRNRVKSQSGEMWLTVPVKTHEKFGQRTNQVAIDKARRWEQKHWRSLEQNYKAAPYFDLYADEINCIYKQPFDLLAELNETVIRWTLAKLGVNKKIARSSELGLHGNTGLLPQICQAVGASTY
jgi:hypothetical protein